MTNFVYLSTVIVTNWLTTPAIDSKRENGTNYFKEVPVLSTNTLIIEVHPCTNITLYRVDVGPTNVNEARWVKVISPQPIMPPLPMAPTPLPTTPMSRQKE